MVCLLSQVITLRSNLTIGLPCVVAPRRRDSQAISYQVELERRQPEIASSTGAGIPKDLD